MADPDRIYRLLLKLYPARFREEYESPLQRQFLDDYREARGAGGRVIFWFRMLGDLAASIPAEILREVTQDLRYAARVYRKRALVTGLALVALALAIGATTGVFSVLNALLLRGLPFRAPDRLVQLRGPVNLIHGQAGWKDIGAHSAYLAEETGFFTFDMTLSRTNEAVRVKVAETAANFFSLLGTEPVIGRPFAPDEDIPGREDVAIIGYGLWQQAFGGDPRVLGSTIRLNGVPMTVIGVSPPGFDYPEKSAVWTPTQNSPDRLPKRGVIASERLARLKPGIPLAQARSMFEDEVRRDAPESLKQDGLNRPELVSLRDQLAGPVRQASLVLLGMVAFVLLIACANVAQLLLSRVAERRQELAVRTALGASRARLVQQLVTEATMLTLVASAGGVGVARWASQLASLTQPPPLALQAYTILDWRVLGFATAVALLTGFVFGVLPAWLMGRFQPSQEMTRVQMVTGRSGVSRMRAGLIATQAAFTLVLLAGSVAMGRSFLKLVTVDLGYRTDHLVTLNVSLTGTSYFDEHREQQYYEQALARLRAVPGVEAAGAVNYLPLMQNAYMGSGLLRSESGQDLTSGIQLAATSEYFRTLKTEIIAGREFTDRDRAGTEPATIVSEDVAQEIAGSDNVSLAVGKKIFQSFRRDFTNASAYTVVGVIRATRQFGPAGPAERQVYFAAAQNPPGFLTFVARVRGTTDAYLPVLRDAVRQVDPGIPVYDVRTLDQRLSDVLARPRFYTTAIVFLAAFAVLLAVIGIYGVAAYSVAQRTKEIGVRIAVGASPGVVRTMLLRQNIRPVAAGMLAGVVGAAGLGKFLGYLMPTAGPVDPWIYAAAAIVLAAIAAGAVWTATVRVVRIDPMNALRAD